MFFHQFYRKWRGSGGEAPPPKTDFAKQKVQREQGSNEKISLFFTLAIFSIFVLPFLSKNVFLIIFVSFFDLTWKWRLLPLPPRSRNFLGAIQILLGCIVGRRTNNLLENAP